MNALPQAADHLLSMLLLTIPACGSQACNADKAGGGKLRIMAIEEQEIPYHVTAISELAKNYTAPAFRVEIGDCRDVIAKLVAEDNRSDQQRARYRILRYLDLQLARSASWVDKEADLMAWVIRNLIELKSWAEFVFRERGESDAVPQRIQYRPEGGR